MRDNDHRAQLEPTWCNFTSQCLMSCVCCGGEWGAGVFSLKALPPRLSPGQIAVFSSGSVWCSAQRTRTVSPWNVERYFRCNVSRYGSGNRLVRGYLRRRNILIGSRARVRMGTLNGTRQGRGRHAKRLNIAAGIRWSGGLRAS